MREGDGRAAEVGAEGVSSVLSQPGAWRIGVVSATILVLELALIRLVPAEIQAISYFTNLILMATFFGLGLGCILQRRRSLRLTVPFGSLLLLAFVLIARGFVIYSEATEVHYWLLTAGPSSTAPRLPLIPSAIIVFLLAAAPFVGLGQQLAREMDRIPRLIAYGWDIFGSLAGTVAFTVTSFLDLPPWGWVPLLLACWGVVFERGVAPRTFSVVAGLAFFALASPGQNSHWSPYYLIQSEVEETGVRVWVNSSFHQFAIDFSDESEASRTLQRSMLRKWNIPYDTYRALNGGRSPKSVLVLGAGTGNDVVVALLNGASDVVAVEIDPVILDIGRKKNLSRPYDDPRVTSIVEDARAYLRSCSRTFDLVVFGTLDSQALLSGQSNVRLENFVYTREAFVAARDLLNQGGVVGVYYAVFEPWLYGRIFATVRASFGDNLRLYRIDDFSFLFNAVIVAGEGVEGSSQQLERFAVGIPSTDDWPFIYLLEPSVGAQYLSLIAVIAVLILGALMVLRREHQASGLYAEFFFLGLGFTLVESSGVVRMALLFGTTWTVNAAVFATVLLMIFLANLAVIKGFAPTMRHSWTGLFAFLLVNVLVPLGVLLEFPLAGRLLGAAVLIGAPVFFAATCFSSLFRNEEVTGYPLGINLIGAMGGGLIEYASMATGMRGVWLIAIAIYGCAWWASNR